MLKTTKYRYITPASARFFLLLLLVICGLLPQCAMAQGYFTLTNGNLYWSNGLENQSDVDWQEIVGYDAARSNPPDSWYEVHTKGNDHVTQITAKGSVYLALDITTPESPKIAAVTAFTPYCAWFRTGYTGYYYQEWAAADGTPYRYYLVGSSDNGLRVVRAEVGKPLEQSTYWYNWDFGAAAWEKPVIDGNPVNNYYWIMFQERNRTTGAELAGDSPDRKWTLSRDSYQRPEDIYYDDYTAYGDAPIHKRYFDGVSDGFEYHPVGTAALFLPVDVTAHEDSVENTVNVAAGDVLSDNNPASSEDVGKPYGLQRTVDAQQHTLHTGITITSVGGTDVVTELTYNPEAPNPQVTLTANIIDSADYKVPMIVRPAYTEYREEIHRRGIHLNYRYRNQEGVFGSAGQGSFETHFYKGGSPITATPSGVQHSTEVDTILFSVNNSSLRYVEVDPVARMSTHPIGTTLTFFSPVNGEHQVEVYVTVRYKNGVVQRDTTTLKLKYTKTYEKPQPKTGPVVRGAVYGGGRMANVGGGTQIIIHSADDIPTVYGGNDIAGWVQGDAGANLRIGTEYTVEEHPVRIGNVYGGGNGYYTYQGINALFENNDHTNPYYYTQSTSLCYQAYYFNGKVYPWNSLPQRSTFLSSNTNADNLNHNPSAWTAEFTPVVDHQFTYTPFFIGRPDEVDQQETGDDGDGTIPYIKTAHISVGVPEGTTTIRNKTNTADSVVNTFFVAANGDSTHWHNDYVTIDTLFGGARNAFIGVTANEGQNPENGVTIDINGGTIYSVFGGNNVGGSVANTSTVFVNVHDTKLIPEDEDIEETFLSGFGRDFGIRYLFGGGNLVDGSHANVKVTGGMIDTVFLGGNNATVTEPIGTVECLRGNDREGFGYNGHFICTNPTYPTDLVYTNPVEALAADEHFFDGFGPDNFSPEEGKYNVRCLFGGNNAADMANITTIQLHSGGISCVYGGGNVGDMTNNARFTADSLPFPNDMFMYNNLFNQAFDINPDGSMQDGGWAKNYGKRSLPQRVGTIVTALPDSKIVCDYVFGGSRMGNVKNACGVYLSGGIFGYVNGGNDVSGDVGSETGEGTYLLLDGNALVVGDAIAGSDGYYHCEDQNNLHHYDDGELYDTYSDVDNAVSYDPYNDYVGMLFPTHNNVNLYMRGGLVLGQLVGGAVHADVGFNGSGNKIKKLNAAGERVEQDINLDAIGGEKHGTVHLMASGGRVMGNVFGGGFQSHIHGLAYLTLRKNIQIDGAFFSGNDCTGSINSFGAYMNPDKWKEYFDSRVQPGMSETEIAELERQADSVAYGDMETSDGTKLNTNDGSWNANYSAYLRIEDTPIINQVYGSGNGAYDYFGNRPEYESITFCPDVTGTGLTPKQSSTFIDIHTSGGTINTVFGGGNGVGVERDVVVLLNNTSSDVHTVHTIFGGNNQDDMLDVVPEIRLKQGIVNTVFGGANNGVMGRKSNDFKDILGNPVKDVSTHVVVESPNVTVEDTIFGGNRMSNVDGTTFVEVKNTKAEGVRYIFGGNDISGSITGIARVDVSGGVVKNLFGGSDGRYDYLEIGDNMYNVYPFGFVNDHPTWFDGHTILSHADSVELEEALLAVAARPDVDSTNINIWGGTMGEINNEAGGIYGGGSMAECRATCVIVNDTVGGTDRQLIIHGAVYGGGMGNYADLNARDLQGKRYGNVNENTYVNLYHAKEITSAKAYGGGRGGDVMNTFITTYSGWDTPFDELYGGCWGSEVHGTAHLDFSGINLVQNLYGGNDFSGDVYKTVINVNSGRFYNIYGAGNGAYSDDDYTTDTYADDLSDSEHPVYRHIRRPNTEYVNLTFNGGEVEGNLYGGGKMGSTWTYKKDSITRAYIYENGYKVPDIDLNVEHAHSNPLDYSYIITNIHNGIFHNNVFCGASGRGGTSTDALVYGLKVLNMDGGEIRMSLYGGSESVSDGYASECVDKDHTTKRPSSIVNITGGTVESNLYGAGYLGTTYGSVYVNVGVDAIDSCEAYSATHVTNSDDSLYWKFKPGENGSLSPALSKTNIELNHSIYAGANWGAGTGQSNFFTQGFNGGESSIIVDGKNYNTGADELNMLPQMNIKKSLFGSGTSVLGGDVHSKIELRNYGELDNCHPTKELESVQRAKYFFSHNTAIHYLGATDATTAYISEPYSILRIDTMCFRGFNVAEYDAPLSFISNLYNYEEELNEGNLELVPVQTLRDVTTSADACGNTATMCGYTAVVDPIVDAKKHTLMVLNNGIDFKIQRDEPPLRENYYTPGYVKGFSYIATPYGYSSSVTALATAYYWKDSDPTVSGVYSWLSDDPYWGGYTWADGYSGFVSPCDTTNRYATDRGGNPLVWLDSEDGNYVSADAESPYTNFIDEDLEFLNYREWKVGGGTRLRETAILAHADPEKLEQDVNVMIDSKDLALAKASIVLPATSEGHYYKLDPNGIIFAGSSSAVNMVDEAWLPDSSFATMAAEYPNDVQTQGSWIEATLGDNSFRTGRDQIVSYPDNTFGLLMVPGQYFQTSGGHYVMPAIDDGNGNPVTESMSKLVLSGNAYYNASAGYCSPKVVVGDRVMPSMDFYLTYNPNFATTFLGTVEFTLDEYDENNYKVGPVKVKAYLSTIIDNFREIETNVLAMFNNGTTNEFTRRVILPITLDENRELYITSVQWEPTNGNGVTDNGSERFYLTENAEDITNVDYSIRNRFGIHLIPNDAITGDLNENLGWTAIDKDEINLFTLARATGSGPQKYAKDGNDSVVLRSESAPNGMRVGILDGRGTAAINVKLLFDGERVYPENGGKGYLGKAVIGMRWVKGEKQGNFKINIYVKTREHGDTIFLASDTDYVRRGAYTVYPFNNPNSDYNTYLSGLNPDLQVAAKKVGKSPNSYVNSFQHALSSSVYQEGDVIAIIDQVNINERPVHIQGADGPPIQVIRYAGHHHELPSELGVYRGPMVVVSGENNLFTAQNIDFHGSAGAVTKVVERDAQGALVLDANGKVHFLNSFQFGDDTHPLTTYTMDKQPDTNRVFAPIIMIKDNGSVTLSEGTLVRHNWNAYGHEENEHDADGLSRHSEMMGAISVTGNGTLTLKGDVIVRDNLCHTIHLDLPGDEHYNPLRPGNGAIYVDGGNIVLPQSHKKTVVDITRNRMVDPAIHTSAGTSWWQMAFIDNKPSRFTLDTAKVYENWQKANVYLTRTQPTSLPSSEEERIALLPVEEQANARQYYLDMHDLQSDNIQVLGVLGDKTRIGVRKWFPGLTTRDTIRFAVNKGVDFTVMEKIYKNKNFQEDDNFRIFYNQDINNVAAYLFRCATFRHQSESYNLPIAGNIQGQDVLQYNAMDGNSCPTGGDVVIYSLQGGFAPYSYTWTVKNGENYDVMRDYTTPYPNTLVTNRLNDNDNSLYLASIADTLLTPSLNMRNNINTMTAQVRVSAVDATGECQLYKDMKINVKKVGVDGLPAWERVTSPDNGWTDTSRAVVAEGNRNYRAVKITPYVWTDGSQGRISARIGSTDVIYQENEDGSGHSLEDLLFCEGEVIRLKTQPTYSGSEFLMWNFEPFNDNPITYTVPPHDDDVIAYYGSTIHWSDTIDKPEEAGVAQTTTYYYEGRPMVTTYNLFNSKDAPVLETKAGYVTTHGGSVHIYNENGLAWFISIVNGLNGYQARPFLFDTIYLHQKDALNTPYDMQKFLWSPVGTRQYGFRGKLVGVGPAETTTTPLTDGDRVVIKNIIINEPTMNYVGFFGLLDRAECTGVALQDIFVRGGHYVGGLAAQASNTTIDNCAVVSDPNRTHATTTTSILTTNYVSGGMVGDATNSKIRNSVVEAKYTGNAVYSGGVAGTGEGDQITNNRVVVDNYANGLYVGGITGHESGEEDPTVCPLGNLRAAVTGRMTTGSDNNETEYVVVNVIWNTSARNVKVSYCEGNSWYETSDNPATWEDARNGSANVYIPASSDTGVHVYTIAVKAICNDTTTSMLTTLVQVRNNDVPVCPEYYIEAGISTDDGYMLQISWGRELVSENYDNEILTIGYCVGTEWDLSQAVTTTILASESDGYAFPLETPLASAYTVGLYSPCSGRWFYGAVEGLSCPEYQVSATLSVTSDQQTNASVTVTWVNTSDYPDAQVQITVCGPQSNQSNNCIGPITSEDPTTSDGNSIEIDISDIYVPGCTTYGVTLTSGCDDRPYEVVTGDNAGGNKGRGTKAVSGRSVIANNYILIKGNSKSQRIGGIVGRSANADIMNNYVYGTVGGSETGGSVTAVMGQGTKAVDNFAAHGTATKVVGRQQGGMLSNSADFEGQGNRVTLDKNIQGVNNLTRALNRWVRARNAEGGEYKTWRSDLEGVNNGYPLFGTPDMIPVEAVTVLDGCEWVVLDGIAYTRDTVLTTHTVDYEEMVDSTVTATIRLHYGTRTQVSDSVEYGESYIGYGFSIDADELRMLEQTLSEEGRVSIVLHDTLATAYGCDSIVTLTLTFTGSPERPPLVETEFSVNVYPNPTKGLVTVEADGMTHVEVYDNEGRKLQDYDSYGSDTLTIDMTSYVSGVYFVRVHSPEKIVIQKVIKQR